MRLMAETGGAVCCIPNLINFHHEITSCIQILSLNSYCRHFSINVCACTKHFISTVLVSPIINKGKIFSLQCAVMTEGFFYHSGHVAHAERIVSMKPAQLISYL